MRAGARATTWNGQSFSSCDDGRGQSIPRADLLGEEANRGVALLVGRVADAGEAVAQAHAFGDRETAVDDRRAVASTAR